jgi:mRNA interferase YafQ
MIIVLSGKFKRDLKRYKHRKSKINALNEVIKSLKKSGKAPIANRPHKLHGIYEGCMECHIEDDFLLIWIDETTNTVRLLRLGTHHELFGL